MKKIIFTSCAALLVLLSQAQQKEGKITYERTAQIQMRIAEGNEEMERMIPKTRVDNFELSFANNQSLWKQAEKENDDNDNFTSGGMHVQMIVAGSDDVLYNNFDTRKKVELRVMFDKKFVIEDSIRPL